MRKVLALLVVLLSLVTASVARADVTTWLAVGGGYALHRGDASGNVDQAPTFTASLGVGSSPEPRFIAGGIFRVVTNFGLGTDISLAARLATRGFVRGGFGLAADFGLAYRITGQCLNTGGVQQCTNWRQGDYGELPLQGVLTVGLPLGLQIGIGVTFWNLDFTNTPNYSALGGFAVLEMDLLRLTLMRKGVLEGYWPNPSAAGDIGRDK